MWEDNYLTDVTLACKDGQQEEAHKVVLASSSPFFHKLFARNRQAHPLIYMGGVKSSDGLAILDFLSRLYRWCTFFCSSKSYWQQWLIYEGTYAPSQLQ